MSIKREIGPSGVLLKNGATKTRPRQVSDGRGCEVWTIPGLPAPDSWIDHPNKPHFHTVVLVKDYGA